MAGDGGEIALKIDLRRRRRLTTWLALIMSSVCPSGSACLAMSPALTPEPPGRLSMMMFTPASS